MRVVIVGLGVQGKKRLQFAGSDAVATVDPFAEGADHRRIEDVPLEAYDAALCCVPDSTKQSILRYLLENGKHVLVEKPLLDPESAQLQELKNLAESRKLVCYTAYNHRFEPHISSLKNLLDDGEFGTIYRCKFFYGNGTARDVRNSAWRDHDLGVISDLGSHLLDLSNFLFGAIKSDPQISATECFENNAFYYASFRIRDQILLEYEMTLLSWRNTFRLDLYAENATAHIDCLCKWGPSTLTVRRRVLPSGRPDERSEVLSNADPTWEMEYRHFVELCRTPTNNMATDIWINGIFNRFRKELKCA